MSRGNKPKPAPAGSPPPDPVPPPPSPDTFEAAPVALWLEDVSGIVELFAQWRAEGMEDLEAALAKDPDRARQCNDRLTILRVNRTGLELFGVETLDELLERRKELFPPMAFPIFIEQLLALWDRQPSMNRDGRFRTSSGTTFDAAVSMRFLQEQDRTFMLATLSDITDRRDVARHLAGQARDLARTNAELEQFAYVVSHDLRTPLRQIASFGQLLAKRYAEQLDDTAEGWIAHIVEGAASMDQMLTSLDEYTRLGGDPDTFHTIDLNVLVRRVISEVEHGRSAADLDWRVVQGPLPSVFGDQAQIAIVFRSLLENALRFRCPERLYVSITAEDGADGMPLLSVRDNGVGIEPRQGARIFEVFQRGHSSERYAGAGLGLALAKKAVTRHGGRIWFDSAPGEGTTFHFTLPHLQIPP